jgi:hypothetical protein
MVSRRGTSSRRMTSSLVWNGTPLVAMLSGIEGRAPAATTTRSAVIVVGSPPSVGATDSVRSPVKRACPR